MRRNHVGSVIVSMLASNAVGRTVSVHGIAGVLV